MSDRELPPIASYRRFSVVRGDLIEGGFKRLSVSDIFAQSPKDKLVFASNSHGFGALALSLSLSHSGKQPIIFLSESDSISPNLSWCQRLGAKLDFSGKSDLADSTALRTEAEKLYADGQYEVLPLGLDTPQVRERIAGIAKALFPVAPRELWVAAASGLVARTLCDAFPFTKIHAVLVKHNNPDIGRAEPHLPDEKFDEPALIHPPFPAADHYDAKVWRLALERGARGKEAAIFNIA